MAPTHPSMESHPTILERAQRAPRYLEQHSTQTRFSLPSPITAAETPDQWNAYEQLLISCLQSGDDKSAHMCLERLSGRFGASNERIMGLKGMYEEAVAEGNEDLDRILRGYGDVLLRNPTNGVSIVRRRDGCADRPQPIAKRRAALLRSLGRHGEAIAALNDLLETSPTDVEAWAELSELYFSRALYSRAAFCMEEVLLIAPNAWNVCS